MIIQLATASNGTAYEVNERDCGVRVDEQFYGLSIPPEMARRGGPGLADLRADAEKRAGERLTWVTYPMGLR